MPDRQEYAFYGTYLQLFHLFRAPLPYYDTIRLLASQTTKVR